MEEDREEWEPFEDLNARRRCRDSVLLDVLGWALFLASLGVLMWLL